MKIKFNDTEYSVKPHNGEELEGFLRGQEMLPVMPEKGKLKGIIETEDGCYGIVDYTPKWLIGAAAALGVTAVVCVGMAAYMHFNTPTANPIVDNDDLGIMEGVDTDIPDGDYVVNFNHNMTWRDGFVDINLVTEDLPVVVFITMGDQRSDGMGVGPGQNVPQMYLDMMFPQEVNDVIMEFTVDDQLYTYPATITAVQYGDVEEEPVISEDTIS